ncbi:sensor histidine kinase [Nocardioides sp.]|jgi:two-component system LytT family sensor kinase|uniref:sensor histidine kinase n=1 Tax=Nocardioides sp. TaxID=35761 RepID=UPI002F3ECFD7
MPRRRVLRPGYLGTEADRATFRTLHTATQMTSELRTGLTRASAEHCVRPLARLLGSPAVAVTDTSDTLAWYGVRHGHVDLLGPIAERCVSEGRTGVRVHRDFDCDEPGCPLRQAIVAPLTVEDTVVGTLIAFTPSAAARLVRATDELAQWVSGQLELAELDVARTSRMEAEVRALRAQISPHFVYNVLTTIASFVRTDPDRARELILQFADFTRHSFQRAGSYTTLEDELRSIERYLALEQARFGDRLAVLLRIAPEVLGVSIPVLSLQPLVENGVRHGLAGQDGRGTITILAEDNDYEAVITVEDDGVGEEPDRVRRALAGDESMDSIGLGNVDQRLRSAYGDEYGLVVETAPGAGTRVTVRVPKFAAGVRG